MASTLVLISSAPTSPNAAVGLRLARLLHSPPTSHVGVFLLQDGVPCALRGQELEVGGLLREAMAEEIACYCLKEDVTMRGFELDEVLPQVRLVGYEEMVDLLMEGYDRVFGAF